MASFQFAGSLLVTLLGLFIFNVSAQDQIPYGPNGAKIFVPVGRQLNSVYQPIPEKSGVPSKFYALQNENEIPRPYEFGYQMNDGNGTTQHRQEIRQENGDIKGSYGYVDPLGVYRKVEYYTDANGYHAKSFFQRTRPFQQEQRQHDFRCRKPTSSCYRPGTTSCHFSSKKICRLIKRVVHSGNVNKAF
ncbi:hypothetical protein CEXT_620201 [Caerostris extrusa]|uniref:Uncharacterized protein n=1 Tax=Caerostris extrusa TaxID=172846 RepID=A0AAV4NRZ4_CAEEX|nr:hypothetical protein CEXT_620201 [Caerostris extrusa]